MASIYDTLLAVGGATEATVGAITAKLDGQGFSCATEPASHVAFQGLTESLLRTICGLNGRQIATVVAAQRATGAFAQARGMAQHREVAFNIVPLAELGSKFPSGLPFTFKIPAANLDAAALQTAVLQQMPFAPSVTLYIVERHAVLQYDTLTQIGEATFAANSNIIRVRGVASPGGAGGQGQGQRGGGGAEPPYKKVKITASASDLADASKAEKLRLIPKACYDRSSVAFYTGRNNAVPVSMAQPVLLQAPEFGLVSDAAYGSPGCITPLPKHFQAAEELCDLMAVVYDLEEYRQQHCLTWFVKHFGSLPQIKVPARSSTTGSNDGQMNIGVNGLAYVIGILEVKIESGDAVYQALRYIQQLYKDGERWAQDPVLRASGAPVLVLELQGTCLTVHGAYTIEGNVMAAEPLTPRLLLLPLLDRQEQPGLQLARVLAGFEAAALLLHRRFEVMSGKQVPPLTQLLDELQLGVSAEYKAALGRALGYATLGLEEAKTVAARRGAQAGGPPHLTWARLPYPLAHASVCPSVRHVPGHERQPLFICKQPAGPAEPVGSVGPAEPGARVGPTAPVCSVGPTEQEDSVGPSEPGGSVLVKFTCGEYPVKVHQVLAELGLTPQLLDFLRLPGGWCMVVQEHLGDDWTSCSSLKRDERQLVFPAVQTAVSRMHQAQLEGGKIAHGDLRSCNVMWHKKTGQLKIVDLDWAGLQGHRRYPSRMSQSILWHARAKPGMLLHKDHDLYMISQFVE